MPEEPNNLTDSPPIAFVGVTNKAITRVEGHPPENRQIYHNLSKNMQHIIYPTSIRDLTFVFAVYNLPDIVPCNIIFRNEVGDNLFATQMEGLVVGEGNIDELSEDITEKTDDDMQKLVLRPEQSSWTLIPMRFDANVYRPANAQIFLDIAPDGESDIDEILIGNVDFHPVSTPDYEEVIDRAQSEVNAQKYIKFSYECDECDSNLLVYSGVTESPDLEEQGYQWNLNLDDHWECKCESQEVPLKWLRMNLHALLLPSVRGDTAEDIGDLRRLYTEEKLNTILQSFSRKIQQEPEESEIQEFLEENPVVFSQYRPKLVIHKPEISGRNRHEADFGIIDNRNRLILVEIEKPDTRIIKDEGGQHSDLTHAFDQVSDWLYELAPHRNAYLKRILNDTALEPNNISEITGMVIAGRDEGYDLDELTQQKTRPDSVIDFLTYDDLVSGFSQVINAIADA